MSEPNRYEYRSWSPWELIPIYVATAPLPDEPPLAGEQVAALPAGTRVTVRWGGGNGPHHYRIRRDEDGTLWALSSPGVTGQDPLLNPAIDKHLFGPARWQHKVWVA